MMGSWTKGNWKATGDTIYFHMIPTYDTLSVMKNDKTFVSLVLSNDEIAERITPLQDIGGALSSGGQNRNEYPDKLLFRKGRLYKIKDGKLVRKKIKSFWSDKKYIPWYFKSEE